MTLFRMIQRKGPKRGSTMVHGRVQAAWLVKLHDDIPAKPWRRVYEDWSQVEPGRRKMKPAARKPVPLVLVIGDEIVNLTPEQRAELEAYQEPTYDD